MIISATSAKVNCDWNVHFVIFAMNQSVAITFNSMAWFRQCIHFNRNSAGWIFFKVFGINAVEGLEIAFHVHQKNAYIHNFIPTASAFFQSQFYIFKNGMIWASKSKAL